MSVNKQYSTDANVEQTVLTRFMSGPPELPN